MAQTSFPSPSDLTKFFVVVAPDSGFWKGATYQFSFNIPPDYPHKPPKVGRHVAAHAIKSGVRHEV